MSEDEEDSYGLDRLVEFECISLPDYYPENSKVGYAVPAYELKDEHDYQQPGTPLRYSLPVTAHFTPFL